ncbi:MAG TPA: YceH family protein [Gaiella sp.]|nr:YceH family protein [Gaiella sp.]
MDADAVELRVLGCLLEKQRTTPDQYPLTLNALRNACNQTTNRDPVVAYDEAEIHEALQRLARRGWTRLASGAGSRAAKYRQLFDDALGLPDDQTAILCALMLRGAQTPGELKQRTERLHRFVDLADVHSTLDELGRRELVERLDRRPGQKEERYRHLLGEDAHGEDAHDDRAATPLAAAPPRDASPGLEARVAVLETGLRELRGELDSLRARLRD